MKLLGWLLLGALSAHPQPVIRSTTRLVQIRVFATTGLATPVTDLRREDFRVFDNGKEQPIAVFAVEGPAAAKASPAALPAAGGRDREAGYSAILLDWLNAGLPERLRGDDAVRKVLRAAPPRQSIGVFLLGAEPPHASHPLRMIWDFRPVTADFATLIDDPWSLPNPEIPDAPGKFDARFGSGARNLNIEEQIFDWNNRIQDTVRGLSELADSMARLPGRKSLVWLTTGFPLVLNGGVIRGAHAAEVVYVGEVERVLARLNRYDVTVHVIDTLGLATIGRSYHDALCVLTDGTGGTLFAARNDLDTGVRAALEDLHAGYTLGFVVPPDAQPGPHRIEVRTRRRGVRLRFRNSYELGL